MALELDDDILKSFFEPEPEAGPTTGFELDDDILKSFEPDPEAESTVSFELDDDILKSFEPDPEAESTVSFELDDDILKSFEPDPEEDSTVSFELDDEVLKSFEPDPEEDSMGLWQRVKGGAIASYHQDQLAYNFENTIAAMREINELKAEDGEDLEPKQLARVSELEQKIKDSIATFGEHEEGLKANPPSEEMRMLLSKDGSVLEALKKGHYKLAFEATARSAVPSLKAGALGLGGGLVGALGGPVGAVAGAVGGTALGSFSVEFDNTMLAEMQSQGIDIKDQKALESLVKDDDKMSDVMAKALIRGGIIGSIDGVAQGLAFLKLVPKGVKSKITRNVLDALSQTAVQGTAGGTGEALAQLATEGEIHLGEIVAEVLGELGTAPIEIAVAAGTGSRGIGSAVYDEELGRYVPETGATEDMRAAEQANLKLANDFLQQIEEAPDPEEQAQQPAPITPAEARAEVEDIVAIEGGDTLDQVVAGEEAAGLAEQLQPIPEPVEEEVQDTDAEEAFKQYIEFEDQLAQEAQEDEQATTEAEPIAPEAEPIAPEEPALSVPESPPIEETPAPVPEVIIPAEQSDTEDLPEPGEVVVGEVAGQAVAVDAQPTEAKKKTGNYRKGHIRLNGLDISIENLPGTERSGVGPDGQPWSVTMPSAYGYVRQTKGADGDQVDVYVGNNPEAETVFVVDQVEPDTQAFDEHKAMMGFASEAQALETYEAAFSDTRGAERIGGVTALPVAEFKNWLQTGDTTQPIAGAFKQLNKTFHKQTRC